MSALSAARRALPALLALRLVAPYLDVHTLRDLRDRLESLRVLLVLRAS